MQVKRFCGWSLLYVNIIIWGWEEAEEEMDDGERAACEGGRQHKKQLIRAISCPK